MCPHEESVVAFHLRCVRGGERRYGLIELGGFPDVPSQARRVAGSRMPFGQHFATEACVFPERPPVELRWIQGGFVIRQLPDQVIVPAESCIAEESVR